MGKINWGRVILGGLVAGVVLNIGEYVLNEAILGDDWEAVMQSYGRETFSGSDIAIFVALTFLLGIVLVWLYAAVRPRFGPGVGTALRVGLVAWIIMYLLWYASNLATEFFPQNLVLTAAVWGFFELPIGTAVGAWLYKEEPAAAGMA